MTQKPAAFVILILAFALGTTAPRSQSRVEVAQTVSDRAAAGEMVSVIVGVDATFVPEGDLAGPAAVDDQRTALAETVGLVMARAAAVGVTVGKRFDFIPYFTATVNRLQLEALATTQGVASIQENRVRRASLQQSVPLVNAPAAWSAGHNGTGRVIAVVDSGVQKTHPFLSAKVVAEACYSGSGGGTSVCPGGATSSTAVGSGVNCSAAIEGCEHGTHIAGIVAGVNASGTGVNGVAPGANLIAMQVFTRFDGTGTLGCGPVGGTCIGAFDADVISALGRVQALAGTHAIAAVNMSLGGEAFADQASCNAQNAAMRTAIINLRSLGIAAVIASGNEFLANALASPACITEAVSVGATTDVGSPLQVPGFSNDAPFLNLLAPGVDITSSILNGGFESLEGTSMAAPHVAGAWAILKQAAPAASVSSILAALISTGTPVTDTGTGRVHPFINVNAARLALIGTPPPPPVGLPGAPTSFTANVSGSFLSMTWGAPASGGAPTSYTLRARVAPGGAPIVNFPLGNQLTFGLNAPNGVYYLSVFATNATGVGPESNVVPVSIPSLSPPPGAPTNLQAAVSGNAVVFMFAPPTTGGAVVNFVLLGGLTPGFAAPVASLPLGPTQTAVAIPGVPPGTWFVRVVAQNAGGMSAPTNEVSFTIAGPTPPGAPTLNPAAVAGNTVSLSWAPGAGGAPTSYTLFAAATPGGAPFLSQPLSGTTAIAFGDVPTGTYFVRMVAHNALGTSLPSNEITIVVQ